LKLRFLKAYFQPITSCFSQLMYIFVSISSYDVTNRSSVVNLIWESERYHYLQVMFNVG